MAPRLELDSKTLRLILISFLILAGLTVHRLFFAGLPDQQEVLIFDGETMGTTYQVRIAGDDLTNELRQSVELTIQNRLTEVDGWMSNWNRESEISQFNQYQETDSFPVSFATAELITLAIEINKATFAAFDITIGPLVALWGFGNEAQIDDPPTQAEIDELLKHTGARILSVGRGNPTHGGFLEKKTPETRIDLSAIAKGYGVDHVAAGLFDLGRRSFLIEIGGEIRASGERPGGGAWRVAVEKPNEEGRAIQTIVELRDQAMATSGDYRIFYHQDDRRISHTIDPRTGRPVEKGPASATTLHRSATIADAWATALMVMGEDGLDLAERAGIAAMLMWRNDDGSFAIRKNGLFPKDAISIEKSN